MSAAVQLCLISIAARDIAAVGKGRVHDALYPHIDSRDDAHWFAHTPIGPDVEDDLDTGKSPAEAIDVLLGGGDRRAPAGPQP